MNKNLTLLTIAALMAGSGFAATITPEQALNRAISTVEGRRIASAITQPVLAYTALDASGSPAVYVFNNANNGGTLILSADDVALPVLGYTDEGSFDAHNIPPVVNYWFGEYARQISRAKSAGLSPDAGKNAKHGYPAEWKAIHPLMVTQWNQESPYNRLCPTINGKRPPTGCVATAMAQVMYYWKYPEIGEGTGTATAGSKQTMDLGERAFEWDKMLPRYTSGHYTDEQADAVAYLMKACGYGATMVYGIGGSGAPGPQAGISMIQNFRYDPGMKRALRCTFRDSDWAALIYEQLLNVGPVIYDGESPEGGHCFVVDGYDGNGYFHLNWGWGGSSNGFYLLTALNPTSQGSGGSFGGFNSNQGIMYDIKKGNGQSNLNVQTEGQLTLFGNLNATVNNSSQITLELTDWNADSAGYANLSMGNVTMSFAVAFQSVDEAGNVGGEITYVEASVPTLPGSVNTIYAGSLYPSSMIKPRLRFPDTLGEGTFKATICYKESGKNEYEYFDVPFGYHDYFYVTRLGRSYKVDSFSVGHITIESADILSPLYYGYPCLVEFTFKNDTDEELTNMVRPSLLIDGVVQHSGDTYLVVIPPRTTLIEQIKTTFYRKGNGKVPTTIKPVDFTLGAYDHNYDFDYGTFGTYTMNRSGSNLKVNLTELEIVGASEKNEVNGQPFYGIWNFSSINVKAGIEVSGASAFLGSPLIAVVSEVGSTEPEVEKQFENYIYLEEGDNVTETTVINFEDYDPTKTYTLTLYYISSDKRVSLGSVNFGADSGVEGVTAESESLLLGYNGNAITANSSNGIVNVTVFTADGVKMVERSGDSQSVAIPADSFGNGIYIVTAVDTDGNSKTLKIRK